MSPVDLSDRPAAWLTWLGGLLCVLFASGTVALMAGLVDTGAPERDSAVHIEEFRVAEPLAEDPDRPLRDQLETITAVTEPYDDVEPADQPLQEESVEDPEHFERQCATVLKEMAFCTDEDAFLEIIGEASTLQTGPERERFMAAVQEWFEPDGARRYCEVFYDEDGLERGGGARMWRRAAEASGQVCEEFGKELIETEMFEALGPFWQQ